MSTLAEVLYARRDPSAETVARAALANKLKAVPRGHDSVAVSLTLVGHLQAERGDAAGAEPILREALATFRKTLPDSHPRVAQVKGRLGSCLLRLNRKGEGEPFLRQALEVLGRGKPNRESRWIESRLHSLTR